MKKIKFTDQSDWTNRVTFFKYEKDEITKDKSGADFDLNEEQLKQFEDWKNEI